MLALLRSDHSFALKQAASTNVSPCKSTWPCSGDRAHWANADAPLQLHNPASPPWPKKHRGMLQCYGWKLSSALIFIYFFPPREKQDCLCNSHSAADSFSVSIVNMQQAGQWDLALLRRVRHSSLVVWVLYTSTESHNVSVVTSGGHERVPGLPLPTLYCFTKEKAAASGRSSALWPYLKKKKKKAVD